MSKALIRVGLTDEQKALRRQFIGASEIASLAGLAPRGYPTPLGIYLNKTGEAPDDQPSEHMLAGTLMEPVISALYTHKTGVELIGFPTIVHRHRPHAGASIDRVTANPARDGFRIVELKNVDRMRFSMGEWGAPWTGEIPEHFACQLMWQGFVLKSHSDDVDDRLQLAALVGGNELVIYELPYDEEEAGLLDEIAGRFWRDHVVPRRPPPLDYTDSTAEYLLMRHPRAVNDLVAVNDSETIALVTALREVKLAEAARDDRIAFLTNRLKSVIGDSAGIVGLDMEGRPFKITWLNNKDGYTTDYKAVVTELLAELSNYEPQTRAEVELLLKKHTRAKPGPRVFRTQFEG